MSQPVSQTTDRFAGVAPTPQPNATTQQQPVSPTQQAQQMGHAPTPQTAPEPIVAPQVASPAPAAAPVVPQEQAAPTVIQQTMDINQVNAMMQRMNGIHTAAGGQEAFNAAMAWAADNQAITPEQRKFINDGLNSDNAFSASQAAKVLSDMHRASDAFVQTPQVIAGDSHGAPQVSVELDPLTSRGYAEALNALRTSGEWDGYNYDFKPVKELKARLINSVNNRHPGAYV